MRFLCMGYSEEKKWDTMPESERQAMMEECLAYDDVLWRDGHWVGRGEALQGVRTAKTLRWNGQRVVVTDGPYAETKEQLGGIGVLEAKDIDEAVEVVSKHPCVRLGGPFEIRPVDEEINAFVEARQKRVAAATKIFVNLPVKDLHRSVEFFTKLGFKLNPRFTDETAACMIVSDDVFVMLLTEAKFAAFTPKEICDAARSTEVLVCLTCSSRGAVDDMVEKAVAAGGATYAESKDYGFMYQHGFQDPDGHIWELVSMDAEAVQGAQEPAAAGANA